MKFISKEEIRIASMGKKIPIRAIFDNNDEANVHMTRNPSHAVIACFGKLVFIADVYDK